MGRFGGLQRTSCNDPALCRGSGISRLPSRTDDAEMAAALEQTITVMVKSLAGPIVELEIQPRDGEQGVIRALHAANAALFPREFTHVVALKANGTEGRVEDAQSGDMLMATVEPPHHVKILACVAGSKGTRLYRVAIRRSGGIQTMIMMPLDYDDDEAMGANRVQAVEEQHPWQTLFFKVGGSGAVELLTEHPEAAGVPWERIPVKKRGAGQSDADYLSDVSVYYAKFRAVGHGLQMVSSAEGKAMGVRLIRFRILPEAVEELLEHIQKSPSCPFQKRGGGKRSMRDRKRSGNKRDTKRSGKKRRGSKKRTTKRR